MSRSHLSTVASIARHVNPNWLFQPRPLTVTGPTFPFSNKSEEVAVTSHFTADCSRKRSLSATTASCEMRLEVTLGVSVPETRMLLVPYLGDPEATIESVKAFAHSDTSINRKKRRVQVASIVVR